MEINNLEMANNKYLTNENEQKNFLETTLGKTIDAAFDIGIRALFPDFIEEQIIDLKNNLVEFGLKDGINKTINDSIDLGKSALGLITGNFESVNQMKQAVQVGGLIDGISDLVDIVVNKIEKKGVINHKLSQTIKNGKNGILNSVEKRIEDEFAKQYQSVENTNKYINSWKKSFEKRDFNGMEKEYNKLEEQLKNIAPIEKTINEARKVELLHELIKNNGQDFNLSKEQLELVGKLS